MPAEEMRRLVGTLGSQLRAASTLALPPIPAATRMLVCGMGGSGIAGDYLSLLADRAGASAWTHKAYGLPGSALRERPLVVAMSYSGGTEETLSAVEEAESAGLDVVVVGSGGILLDRAREHGAPVVEIDGNMPPRAAFGLLLGTAVRIADVSGVVPGLAGDLGEAAGVADEMCRDWDPAMDLASGLAGRIVAVYGSVGPTGPVTRRWKSQINENAKTPAWWSLFPELDHNEILAWSGQPELSRRVGIVTLYDRDDPVQIRRRIEYTSAVTAGTVDWVGSVHSRGRSLLARMVSLTVMGDMVSVALAEQHGVDPVPIDAIEDLKRRMREDP